MTGCCSLDGANMNPPYGDGLDWRMRLNEYRRPMNLAKSTRPLQSGYRSAALIPLVSALNRYPICWCTVGRVVLAGVGEQRAVSAGRGEHLAVTSTLSLPQFRVTSRAPIWPAVVETA